MRQIEDWQKKASQPIWYCGVVLQLSRSLVIVIKAYGWSQSPLAAFMNPVETLRYE